MPESSDRQPSHPERGRPQRPAGGRGRDGRSASDRPRSGDRTGRREDNRDRGPRREGDSRAGQRDDAGNRGERRPPRRDDGGPRGDRRPERTSDAGEREERIVRPGQARAADEPDVPTDVDLSKLPFGVKAELKSLPKDLADTVAAHIIVAGELVDIDPDLAYRHAEAARRRAARLPIVREAAAETAYASGRYEVALREFRAIRRMSGGNELVPVIADCERALGRPRDALQLIEALPSSESIEIRIEALLVEAGVRDDLGQRGEAMRLLRAAISRRVGTPLAQARLRYAYANLLLASGDETAAREWFTAAAALDPEGLLDTSDRLAELDGVELPESMEIVEEPDEDVAEPGPDDPASGTDEESAE